MLALWDDLIRSRRFWLSYIAEGLDLRGSPTLSAVEQEVIGSGRFWPICELGLVYGFPQEYFLRLRLSTDKYELELHHRSLPAPLLLADRGAHGFPELWRWEEFVTITRYLSAKAKLPSWTHELLLSDYIPITEDCHIQYNAMVQRCLTESDLFTPEELDYLFDFAHFNAFMAAVRGG